MELHSQVQAINEAAPRTWVEYRRGCLSTFGGGHQGQEYGAFRHGMETVFNVLEREFPSAELCKAAPGLLVACEKAHDHLNVDHGEDCCLDAIRQIKAAIARAESRT